MCLTVTNQGTTMPQTLKDKAALALSIAKKYKDSNSSATLAYNDALSLYNTEKYLYSLKRSSTSLLHSVGCFSEEFSQVEELLK